MAIATVPDRATLADTFATTALAMRLGARLLVEKVVRPRPVAYDDIPCNYESVTPQWLTAVLCRNTPCAEVASVRLGRGSVGTSARQQLLVEYNEAGVRAGLPTSVFAKGTPDLITRIAGTVSEAMTGEAYFYRLIRPEIAIEAPMGYHSAFDLKRGRSIHLMEDLAETKGATFCTPQTRLWRTQAEDIVALLATLHGTYYESRRFAGDLAHVVRWPVEYGRMVRAVDLKKYHRRGFERAAHVIPESVRRRAAEVWPAIIASTALHDHLPQTIVHCDVHLGNWYITVGGRMGLLDWQCLARGHWSRDLAYALSATLTIEDRRAWERDLIALYLDMFAARSGVEIDFDEAWLRYRQQMFGALAFWTPTYSPPAFAPKNMQPAGTALEMIRRFTQAIEDLESLDSL